jgi:hypothetical protein
MVGAFFWYNFLVFAALEYTIRSIVLEISAPQLFEILNHPFAEILFGGIGKNDVGFSHILLRGI